MPSGVLVSTTNVLFVAWNVNSISEAKFKLTWTQISKSPGSSVMKNGTETPNCTGNSLVYVGSLRPINISSPGFPYGYDSNQNCTWTFIPRTVGYHVAVQMVNVDLEDVDGCIADYVRIMSSSDLKEYKEVKRVCKLNPTERERYNGTPYLKMEFISDYWTNQTGFLAIAGLGCGGPMTGPGGSITKNMTDNLIDGFSDPDPTCEWTISVRTGRTIRFNLAMLELGRKDDGTCDSYIVLRNGAELDSPFLGIGQYCGTDRTIMTNLQTNSNRAYVRYYPGRRAYRGDFTLNYEEVSIDCGGPILLTSTDSNRTISSPNYPNIPNAHIECIWNIVAPSGEVVRIDFVDRFDLTKSKMCDQEFVEIRDGGLIMSHKIGKYCNETPATIVSWSNIVTIKYFTDVIVPKNGFKANVMIAKCGGFYRGGTSGIIKSPGYPGLGAYPSNSQCEYRVQAKSGSSLNITFLDFQLPRDVLIDNCNDTDHVVFFNVMSGDEDENGTLDKIGTFCGEDIPPSFIADGPEVLIRFITREPNHMYRGFQLLYNSTVEKCGSDIIAESGVIFSPGYPAGRKIRRFCEWKITVPKGRRVKLNILDYDVMPATQSVNFPMRIGRPYNQRIGLYNDHGYLSRIKLLSGADTQTPIYSSDNRMLISMWMFTNIGHRGFKFNFTSEEPTICVGSLNGDSGTFLSPFNVSSFHCEYIRTQPLVSDASTIGTLAIRLTEISQPSVANETALCMVGIPSGAVINFEPNSKSKYFYRNCKDGQKKYELIASPFSSTKLTIKQGFFSVFSDQFQVDYKIHRCGGLIRTNMSYFLVKPTFSANYGELNCAWQFKTIANLKVQVSISHSKFDCDNEYINIYNGIYPTSPKLSRFCGDSVNQSQITLNGHNMFVEYHTSSYNVQSAFELKIQSSYSVCGGILEAPVYNFMSPTNGTQYPNGAECVWEIRANRGFHIGLEFVNRFFIETSINCTKDYVEIFDMAGGEWMSMGRLCGRSMPNAFNSTAQQMKVIFRSDNATSGDGFTVVWRENCGGIFTATDSVQTLTSPRYPDSYPRNTYCNYTLIADVEKTINVKFVDFELEDTSRSCQYDNVTIYKHTEYVTPATVTRVGVYCWKDSLNFMRYKHKIVVIFWSDKWVEKRGFKFEYNLDMCGGIVTNSTAIGIAPLPNTVGYQNQMDCYWNITAPVDKKIVIRFEMFDLEHNDLCYMDSVEVFEGMETIEANRKAKLCGNLTLHSPVINIQSNKALVKFHSDTTNGKHGFSALVLLVPQCDKKVELTVQSPNYTLDGTLTAYDSRLDCHFTVTGPPGHKISLEFDQFHIAPCQAGNTSMNSTNECTCDYVEVKDGAGPFAESISGAMCGHTLPATVISTTAALWIRFVTGKFEFLFQHNRKFFYLDNYKKLKSQMYIIKYRRFRG